MANKKLKTVKTISKRLKLSRGKKGTITIRAAGQDHFNAKQSGKSKRKKRRNYTAAKVITRTIRQAIQ